MREPYEPEEAPEPEDETSPSEAPVAGEDEDVLLSDVLANLATIGRIPLAGVRSQLAEIARVTGPMAAFQAQIRQNQALMASVQSRMLTNVVSAGLPAILASMPPRIDPLAGVRSQLAEFARVTGPMAAFQAQIRQNQALMASVQRAVCDVMPRLLSLERVAQAYRG
ncbi:hypothetical protein OG936_36525 [Streptomyces sp. NBC_00846]|uniref:hypothetical protein n=1 Tax=Streptomyces sp. NBC_00846 TaxID=2975849 RepID=UPI003868E889|nr:hypothetical protein OG936_36525 [Streptomyces sp. NBC_00846]